VPNFLKLSIFLGDSLSAQCFIPFIRTEILTPGLDRDFNDLITVATFVTMTVFKS
jgi:hypothetical protein